MPAPLTVLIVDPSADNREVLRTVLAQRGLRIFEADAAKTGLELARTHHPDVIVLDFEGETQSVEELRDQFAVEAVGEPSRLILLGKVRRGPTFAGGHVIAKPYHFAPLIHTIERLAAKAA
jgi:DNA-binding NtrC family response regulator